MRDELIALGFKPRPEGFLGIYVGKSVWLELNLKTRQTLLFSEDGNVIHLKHAEDVNRVKELYNGLTGKKL